jgi:spermidine synthase
MDETLSEISKKYNHLTDKNTTHSYIDSVYSKLFYDIKDSCQNVLEIGINHGGSIRLWREYFHNAMIYGVDVKDIINFSDPRIKLFKHDAYDINFVKTLPDNFDLIIDDGPHTLESMKKFLQYYQYKLSNNGILIIEDIQRMSWVQVLKNYISPEYLRYSTVYNLRRVKRRWDDVLLVIDKRGYDESKW